MEEQLAVIKTIQPYFVMGTSRFYQYILGKHGISHFYSYEMDKEGLGGAVVPDGCVDIIFEYGQGALRARVCGTVLRHKFIPSELQKTYFGVRFFPGVCPSIIDGKLNEFVDREILFSEVAKSVHLLEKMSEAHTFPERIHTFLAEYKRNLSLEESSSNMGRLLKAMKSIIYGTNGEIRIKDIEKHTGYSTRYINKIFNAELGINPKKFCLIIKFQRFLDHLHGAKAEDIAKLAVDYGYCDQANLIKEFTKFTNMTPGKYYRMIQELGYNDRVINYSQDDSLNGNYIFETNKTKGSRCTPCVK
ncbi:MAG: hypothetical protein H6Q67_1166 [Firmicutes bacterium]|nr:hypothetical protein [Bacillota bacterium]